MSFPLRIVADYHVDRLEVQAWQHVQLTSTNHPIGLISSKSIFRGLGPAWPFDRPLRQEEVDLRVDVREWFSGRRGHWKSVSRRAAGLDSGDHSVVEPPGPIPNPEVKRRSADGSGATGLARVGRCQVFARHLREKVPGTFFVSDANGVFLAAISLLATSSGLSACARV